MSTLETAFIVGLTTGGLTVFILAALAWWNRSQPGVFWFAVHAFLAGCWSFLGLTAIAAETTGQILLFSLLGNGLGLAVGLAWFLFIVEYLGYGIPGTKRLKILGVAGIGGLYFLLYAISYETELLVSGFDTTNWQGLTIATFEPTLLGLPGLIMGFAVFIVGLALVVRAVTVQDQLYAAQSALIFGGTVIPVIAALLITVGMFPSGLPVVPLAAVVSSSLYTLAFWRYDIFSLVPATERIGVEQAFDDLDVGVVVTNEDGTVLRANAAFAEGFDQTVRSLVNESIEGALDEFDLGRASLPTTVQNRGRTYRLSESQVTDDAGVVVGYSLLLIDVTERDEREQRIDVLNRILRHNLRNKLSVVNGNVNMLKMESDGTKRDRLEKIEGAAESLMTIGEKARAYEKAIREESDTERIDIAQFVHNTVGHVQKRTEPTATVETDVGTGLTVETNERLLHLVVSNLLENAIVHNDTPSPHVQITASQTGDAVELTVTDDGPGISPAELEMLEGGEETALTHGSGIGLWIIKWSAERIEGSIDFEVTNDGTSVVCVIPGSVAVSSEQQQQGREVA